MSSPASTVVVKKRRAYRRLLLLTILLIIGSAAGWMIWGAIREWADAKALREYFAELETREPDWQDRVYGKPLTEHQTKDHSQWSELQKLLSSSSPAWGPYRRGLYSGMEHDPAQPAAMLSAEQLEFMKAAHQLGQPLLEKLATMEKLPGHHRFVERTATYEKMRDHYLGLHTSAAYVLNQAVELEAMYHIVQNDPEQALRWFSLCKPMPLLGYIHAPPFLVERWLNLTQPKSTTLLQMQRLLEKYPGNINTQACMNFGSEIRLMEKLFRELSLGELNHKQLDRMGISQSLIHKDSPWNTFWLK